MSISPVPSDPTPAAPATPDHILTHEIADLRKFGKITARMQALADLGLPEISGADDAINAFLFRCGFATTVFNEIDRKLADAITRTILFQSLAYQSSVTEINGAVSISQQFLAAFVEPVRYFTNAIFDAEYEPQIRCELVTLKSWNPISDSTFDTGVICLDATHIGILWAEDED